MLLYLLLALACVAANAFFVAAEFALAKVRPSALEALAQKGDADAQRAFAITRQLDAYLSATQLGITLASLGLGWLGEPALASMIASGIEALGVPATGADGDPSIWVHGIATTVAFAVLSFLHIVLGELVPKSLAIQRPEDVSRYSSRALQWFYYASYPALILLNGCSNLVLLWLKLPAPQHAEGKLSKEELRLVIKASLSERGLEGTERELLERVLRATARPVRAVMVPRVDMITLPLDADLETCMRMVRRFGFSRYPIAPDGDPDKAVGYLYVKDLMMAARSAQGAIRDLKRDILFVPEARSVGEVLNAFQSTKIPIALVVDEYGGTRGLVTLEDVVEELVGDIQDELHVEGPGVRITDDGAIVDGTLPMDELTLEGLVVPPLEGAETVSGYILASLGRLAHPGDTLRLGAWTAVVEDVRRRRVHRVALRPATPDELESRRPSTLPPPREP
ncbi:MAG: HlyC/CorC family transporter [Sandaracinaceae bacterium]|nr:HlyC/CorC family transporter [Sandaracinaceae bacterium]